MCNINASTCGAKLSKFYNTKSGDADALMSAIYQKGPISVAIDASHDSFGFYSEGVYFEKDCGKYVVNIGLTTCREIRKLLGCVQWFFGSWNSLNIVSHLPQAGRLVAAVVMTGQVITALACC